MESRKIIPESTFNITHASIVEKDYITGYYSNHVIVPVTEIIQKESQEHHVAHLASSHGDDFAPGVTYFHKKCQCRFERGQGDTDVCQNITEFPHFVPEKCMIKHLGGKLLLINT